MATKIVLRDVQPVTLVWMRFGMGLLILGAAVGLRGQWARLSKKDALIFAFLGFMGIAFHQWLQSTALVKSEATTAAWIVATSPIFIAMLGLVVLREGLGWLRGIGILLAMMGVMLVVSKGNIGTLFNGEWTSGDLLILISAVNWAFFSVLSRGVLKRHPAARMMLYVMGFGWLFISALFLSGPGLADMQHLTFNGWLGVGFLGIFCSGLAYIAWYDALQALPASQVGVFLYIEPLVTLLVAAVVLGERSHWPR